MSADTPDTVRDEQRERARRIAIKYACPGMYDGISAHATLHGDADRSQYMEAILEALAFAATERTQARREALESQATSIAIEVCQEVCDLPDRTSPEDWPEACLVTTDELYEIVLAAIRVKGA